MKGKLNSEITLPPGTESLELPINGSFVITINRVELGTLSSLAPIVKVLFWGKEDPAPLSQPYGRENHFPVKCSKDQFSKYLLDMAVLRLVVQDPRNSKTLGRSEICLSDILALKSQTKSPVLIPKSSFDLTVFKQPNRMGESPPIGTLSVTLSADFSERIIPDVPHSYKKSEEVDLSAIISKAEDLLQVIESEKDSVQPLNLTSSKKTPSNANPSLDFELDLLRLQKKELEQLTKTLNPLSSLINSTVEQPTRQLSGTKIESFLDTLTVNSPYLQRTVSENLSYLELIGSKGNEIGR